MHTLPPLLRQSWDALFYNRQSLFQMIVLNILPPGIVFLGGGLFLGANWLVRYTNIDISFLTGISSLVLIPIGIILFLIFLIFTLICSYLSMRILANNFKKKQESLTILLSHWRKSADFFWLGMANFLYVIGWALLGSLGFLTTFIHPMFVIPAGLFFVGLMIFIGVPLIMASGIFFFEDLSGFQAIRESRNLVRGRFWKTLGYLGILVGSTLIFVILLGIGEVGINFVGEQVMKHNPKSGPILVYMFSGLTAVWIFVQTVVQIFLKFYYSSYLFTLYKDYKKNPLSSQ